MAAPGMRAWRMIFEAGGADGWRRAATRLSVLQLMAGKHWHRPDMTAEHHAVTIRHWDMRTPLSFRQDRGQAGSLTVFAALAARALGSSGFSSILACVGL